MSKVQRLILHENRHRRLAQEHDRRAELHWNEANKLLIEIQQEDEKEKELESYEDSNS